MVGNNGNGEPRRFNGLDMNKCNDHSMIQAALRKRWEVSDETKLRIMQACVEILNDDEAKGRLKLHAGQTLMQMERQNQTDEIEGAKIRNGSDKVNVTLVQYVDEDGPTIDYMGDDEE